MGDTNSEVRRIPSWSMSYQQGINAMSQAERAATAARNRRVALARSTREQNARNRG